MNALQKQVIREQIAVLVQKKLNINDRIVAINTERDVLQAEKVAIIAEKEQITLDIETLREELDNK